MRSGRTEPVNIGSQEMVTINSADLRLDRGADPPPAQEMTVLTRFERHPLRTGVSLTALVLLLTALGVEIALRAIGLGDPILYETHADYGYRPKPNQRVQRFGGAIVRINNLALRAVDDWDTPTKKVVFLGDSVTYGGSYVSTEDLFAVRGVPEGWVGGSAGVNAWGVGNIYGLVVRHGFLPAHVYVTVLIDNDFDRGLSRRAPYIRSTKPLLAITEFSPHVTERVRLFVQRPETLDPSTALQHKREAVERSVTQLVEMDGLLRGRGFVHLVYLSPSRAHLERRDTHDALVENALARVPLRVVRLKDHPELVKLRQAEIGALYHDIVHLSRRGHEVWSDIIRHDLEIAINGTESPRSR
jgi:hypothetical protein